MGLKIDQVILPLLSSREKEEPVVKGGLPPIRDHLVSAKEENKGASFYFAPFVWIWKKIIALCSHIFSRCLGNKHTIEKPKDGEERIDKIVACKKLFQKKKEGLSEYAFKKWWSDYFAELDSEIQKMVLLQDIRRYSPENLPIKDQKKWAQEHYEQWRETASIFVVKLERSIDEPHVDPKEVVLGYLEQMIKDSL